jgi:hypothetical protein
MKAYGGVEIQLHTPATSPLEKEPLASAEEEAV